MIWTPTAWRSDNKISNFNKDEQSAFNFNKEVQSARQTFYQM